MLMRFFTPANKPFAKFFNYIADKSKKDGFFRPFCFLFV